MFPIVTTSETVSDSKRYLLCWITQALPCFFFFYLPPDAPVHLNRFS